MKKLSVLFFAVVMLLASSVQAGAASYSKAEIEKMFHLINSAYYTLMNLGELGPEIDVVNKAMSEEEMISYGIYYCINNRSELVETVENGQPVEIEGAGRCTWYWKVKFSDVEQALRDVFGYDISLPRDSRSLAHFTCEKGIFLLSLSDGCIFEPMHIRSARRDPFGLVRIKAEQLDWEDEKTVYHYEAVLREYLSQGEKKWHVLMIRPVQN